MKKIANAVSILLVILIALRNKSSRFEQAGPIGRTRRVGFIRMGALAACVVASVLLVYPTGGVPAETLPDRGMIRLTSSCPNLQAVPFYTVLDSGRRIRIGAQVIDPTDCADSVVTLHLYGSAIPTNMSLDGSVRGKLVIEDESGATLPRPGLHPRAATSYQRVQYQVSPYGYESFAVVGDFSGQVTRSWHRWRIQLPTLWVTCGQVDDESDYHDVSCPTSRLGSPDASVGMRLRADERVEWSEVPSDPQRGYSQFVLFRDMTSLAASIGFSEGNPWADDNSLGGVSVQVVDVDREQRLAWRHLLAGTLLALGVTLFIERTIERLERLAEKESG